MAVKDLEGLDAWVNHYNADAREFLRTTPNLPTNPRLKQARLKSYLLQRVPRNVHLRGDALKSSLTYYGITRGAGMAGLVPFGKGKVKKAGAAVFVDQALRAYGLYNRAAVQSLYWDTLVAAGVIQNDALKISMSEAKSELKNTMTAQAKEIWEDDEVQTAFRDELISLIGSEATDEIIHVLPVIGQIWSAGSGVFGAANQLDKVIEVVGKKATVIHKEVIVFAVTETCIPSRSFS